MLPNEPQEPGGDRDERLRAWFKFELNCFKDALNADFAQCLATLQAENEKALRYKEELMHKFFHHRTSQRPSQGPSQNLMKQRSSQVASQASSPSATPIDDPGSIPGMMPHFPWREAPPPTKPREFLDAVVPSPTGSQAILSKDQETFGSEGPGRRTTNGKMMHARTRLMEDDTLASHRSTERGPAFANLRVSRGILDPGVCPNLVPVHSYYKEDGFAVAVAQSDIFQYITIGMIVLNAIYLGFDAALNDTDFLWNAPWPFVLCENVFCTFFLGEWLIRFATFERTRNCMKDANFRFDSVLAWFMVIETWGLGFVFGLSGIHFKLPIAWRLLRMVRLARLERLVRSQPDFLVIARGLYRALRAVLSILLFIGLMNYVASIAIYSVLKDETGLGTYFRSLGMCMWTLLLDGTLMDEVGTIVKVLQNRGTVNCMLGLLMFFVYLALTALILLNLLIGILCEVVTSVAAEEKDKFDVERLQKTVLQELKGATHGKRKTITGSELKNVLLDSKTSMHILQELGVDISYFRDFFDLHFSDSMEHEISVGKVLRLVLECRSHQVATVKSVATATRLTLAWLEEFVMDGTDFMSR